MTDDRRALAERLAREVFGRWFPSGETTDELHIACVLAGLSHRDPHAEREAVLRFARSVSGMVVSDPEKAVRAHCPELYPEPTPPRVTLEREVWMRDGEPAFPWRTKTGNCRTDEEMAVALAARLDGEGRGGGMGGGA